MIAFYLLNDSGDVALNVNSNQRSSDFQFPEDFVSICPHKNRCPMILPMAVVRSICRWVNGRQSGKGHFWHQRGRSEFSPFKLEHACNTHSSVTCRPDPWECSVTAPAAGYTTACHFWPPRLRFLTTAAAASQLFQRSAEVSAGSGDPRFH